MKKATISEIAQMAGVSPMTVTRAFKKNASINLEKREEILALAKEFNYIPNKVAVRLTQSTICIGALMTEDIPEFTTKIVAGLESAYQELMDFKVELDLRLINQDTTIEKCIDILDEFVGNGCKGILLLCSIENKEEFISWAKRISNTNVILAAITEPFYNIDNLFNVSFNTERAGRMACELLSSNMKGKHALLFTGSQEINVHKSLLKSFLAESNKCEIIVDQVYDTHDRPELAAKHIKTALQSFPDVNGIYISSANSVPIVDAIIEMGKTKYIKVIASDVFPKMKEYLDKGAVTATIFQNQYKQAKIAIRHLYECISAQTPPLRQILVEPKIVIRNNVDLYL